MMAWLRWRIALWWAANRLGHLRVVEAASDQRLDRQVAYWRRRLTTLQARR
ncbi:MAG TPA: hypothetical protein VLL25_18070 [Acidimicrobiales bacterium]|nr:hypothetical protein [Acidimicrobiales bacterium]